MKTWPCSATNVWRWVSLLAAQKKSHNDEVTNVDVSCHVTLGTQNQVDCLKAAHNFKELYAQAVVLNPEAPPRSSISGMGSLSESIQHREYALMNVLIRKLRNRDWIQRKDLRRWAHSPNGGGKYLPSMFGSPNRSTHRRYCIDCMG